MREYWLRGNGSLSKSEVRAETASVLCDVLIDQVPCLLFGFEGGGGVQSYEKVFWPFCDGPFAVSLAILIHFVSSVFLTRWFFAFVGYIASESRDDPSTIPREQPSRPETHARSLLYDTVCAPRPTLDHLNYALVSSLARYRERTPSAAPTNLSIRRTKSDPAAHIHTPALSAVVGSQAAWQRTSRESRAELHSIPDVLHPLYAAHL
jgi:hypothetical protein